MNDAERNPVDVPSNRLDRHMRLQPSSPGWPSVPRLRIHTCGLLLCGILLLLGLPGPVSGQQIAGYSNTAGGQVHAFLWQNGVMTDLGTLGGAFSVALGINNAGQIVGYSDTGGGSYHAFLWQNGVMTDLGTLGGQSSLAYGINNAGQIVGPSDTAGGRTHAFVWQNGAMTDLGTLGGFLSDARGINNAGQIVGYSTTAGGQSHAFVWQNGVMTDLGTLGGQSSIAYGINNAGQIVGNSSAADGSPHAFLWQNGVMTDLGVGSANGINNAGQIVGGSQNAVGQSHAFLWQNGVMTDLGTLGGQSSLAYGINNAGQIVGYSGTAGGQSHAFLWQNGGMTDLGTLGGQFSLAFGINDPNLLLDPVPDLLNGPAVVKPSDQVGSQTGAQLLATKGTPVQGVAADGVAQVVMRIPAASGDQLTLTVMNDQQPAAQSISTNEDGALGKPGDTNFFQGPINVTAQDTGKGSFAFAVYRAPVDFARPTGVSAYKSGGCGGTTAFDNQSKCRTVSIRVQNQTKGTTTSIQVRILRAPVILVHGLWGSWSDWKSFGPLVTGPATVDSRFSVGRVSYDYVVGPSILATDPFIASLDDQNQIQANALGLAYNAPRVLTQIEGWIKNFKNGKNPANIPAAVVQADIVAHSMGGVITRTIALQPTFLGAGAFGLGIIHKVVTVDTPHLGSPLAIQLLSAQENGGCLQGLLTRHGKFVLSSVLFSDGTSVSGAMADLQGDGSGGSLSPALQSLTSSRPSTLPTSLITGIYTNFASLDGGVAYLIRHWPYYPVYGCPNDPLAQQLTSTGWPALFNNQPNDGIVSENSQLDGLIPSPSSQFFGYVHSPGTEDLGFSGPSVMDAGAVPNQVIFLLNTPYTNTVYYNLVNP